MLTRRFALILSAALIAAVSPAVAAEEEQQDRADTGDGLSLGPRAAEPAPEGVLEFGMEDIREAEEADAEELRRKLEDIGERLDGRTESARDTTAYAADWHRWQKLHDRAEDHALWPQLIEPFLEYQPEVPSEEALRDFYQAQLAKREAAERERRAADKRREEAEREQRDVRETEFLKRVERQEQIEELRQEQLDDLTRRINVFNQRTNYRHSDQIQRRIETGRDPFPENLRGAYRDARRAVP